MMNGMFPVATVKEIKLAKDYLKQYRDIKNKLELFERNPPTTDEQKKIQLSLTKFTSLIENAVEQVVDPNVKAIVEFRFIKGNSRAATILRFSGWNYCDKTLDRKLEEGVVSVANTLLYFE
ncbi:hypothetical protein [Paenibacillus sp. RC67]|uniref:hypothetical protein n=1 Tax=Paenibacillus sp. RC67 TaxID=3039392 RepID=UPI0024AD410A|nr:hypothetical protein [Paenibacillus sp. RC67]